MRKPARPWQKLHALTVAIEAAELREPYPRLAELMQIVAIQEAGIRTTGARPAYA